MNRPHIRLIIGSLALAAFFAAPAEAKKRHSKKHRTTTTEQAAQEPKMSPANLEARHQVCLAFIKRQKLECDPWQTPTCGAGGLYARPLECVAP